MQITVTSDYAIRILLCLASENRQYTAGEIEENTSVSKAYIMKIMQKLKKRGWVKSAEGATGGYYLAIKPNDLSLWHILEEMESTMRINRCLEDDHYCSRNAIAYCNVRSVYQSIQADLENKLSQLTLEKILSMGEEEKKNVICNCKYAL